MANDDSVTERGFESLLEDIFESQINANFDDRIAELDEAGVAIGGVTTFEGAGVLTRNRGLVVNLESGEEFQITIVRTR